MRLAVPGYRGGGSIVVIGDGRAAEAADAIRTAMSDAMGSGPCSEALGVGYP
jgi:hypothetical protein